MVSMRNSVQQAYEDVSGSLSRGWQVQEDTPICIEGRWAPAETACAPEFPPILSEG